MVTVRELRQLLFNVEPQDGSITVELLEKLLPDFNIQLKDDVLPLENGQEKYPFNEDSILPTGDFILRCEPPTLSVKFGDRVGFFIKNQCSYDYYKSAEGVVVDIILAGIPITSDTARKYYGEGINVKSVALSKTNRVVLQRDDETYIIAPYYDHIGRPKPYSYIGKLS